MGYELTAFLALSLVFLLVAEWGNFAYAPSNIFAQFDVDRKPKPIEVILDDFYAVGKGGTLFVGQYNEYHFLGHDSNNLHFEFINHSDYKYHVAAINSTMTFTCYASMTYCE